MGYRDCPDCWMNPCQCGGESIRQKKEARDFAIKELLEWLDKNKYLTDNRDKIYNEFELSNKRRIL